MSACSGWNYNFRCINVVFLRESARAAAKSRTNLSTNLGKATKRVGRLAPNLAHMCKFILEWIYTPNKQIAPRNTSLGTWGHLGGQQFKSLGKLSDWHQLGFTSADSSGNVHRLNTSRPSIPQGAFRGGGLGCHKFKSLGKLSNGWTDWHQLWLTSADSSGNGHRLNTLRPTISQPWAFRGSQIQMFGEAVKRLDRLAPNLV